MSNPSSENEVIRMLDEVVCDAGSGSGQQADRILSIGEYERLRMLDETVWDASGAGAATNGVVHSAPKDGEQGRWINLACHKCGQAIQAEATFAGKQVRCPNPTCCALVDVPA